MDPYSGGYEPTASAQVRFQLLSFKVLEIIDSPLQWSAPPPGYGGEGEGGGYPGERYGRRRDSREDRCVPLRYVFKTFFCVYELCYFCKLIWEPFEADTGRESMTEEREKGAAGEDAAGADQGKGLPSQLLVFETMFRS